MLLHLIAVFVGLCVAVQGGTLQKTHAPFGERIVGGSPIDITKAPYLVQISDTGVPICGGSIISDEHILTAARCTNGRTAGQLTVRSGTSILNKGGVLSYVSSIFQNPSYNEKTFDFDVAVLKLTEPLIYNEQTKPINLTEQEPGTSDTVFLAGWGKTKQDAVWLPPQLQSITISIADRKECNKTYPGMITNNTICTVVLRKDACLGDAGGPMVVNGLQAGIVSLDENCGSAGSFGVGSNVATLREFIEAKMKGHASSVIASKLNLSLSIIVFILSFKF